MLDDRFNPAYALLLVTGVATIYLAGASSRGVCHGRRHPYTRLGIAFLALFDPTMRAVQDQLYESEQPFVVDHSKYARAFGGAATPHREAIQVTPQWYRGSLHTSG